LSWGVDVTHLDAHMNVMQARTDLFEVYLEVAELFRLPVRMFSRDETARQGFGARERATARGILFNCSRRSETDPSADRILTHV